jgi:hypothetical protein
MPAWYTRRVIRLSRPSALAGLVLVLIPVLAVLQYRWVGELGAAARERMQRNLHTAAQQFRDTFEGELARAFLGLQVDSGIARDEDWGRYAERHAAWANTTAYAGIVANVYLIDRHGGEPRLRRWDAARRAFVDSAWRGELAAARPALARELDAFAAREPHHFDRRVFRDYETLLVAPLVNIHLQATALDERAPRLVTMASFTVIELNLPLIEQHLLPELARRHFSGDGDDAYHVAVVDAADNRRAIYRSAPEAPPTPASADVDMPLFATHQDPLLFLSRGPVPTRPGGADKRDMVISVFRERRDERMTIRSHVETAATGRWRLLARHERGSLAAAVASMRQRNLVISFGVLLLMGVSVALLTGASRRAHRLGQQRMESIRRSRCRSSWFPTTLRTRSGDSRKRTSPAF